MKSIKNEIKKILARDDRKLLLERYPDQLERFDKIKSLSFEFLHQARTIRSDSAKQLVHSTWDEFSSQLENQFIRNPRIDFFHLPVISTTMNGNVLRANTQNILNYVIAILGKNVAEELLQEDLIGSPVLLRPKKYNTSLSRVIHVFQLAKCLETCSKISLKPTVIVEWGGGFGGLASLYARYLTEATYVIIDIPEVLCLQKIYLDSVLGLDSSIINCSNTLIPGKINLISVLNSSLYRDLAGDLFISAWALSESSFESQVMVYQNKMFKSAACFLAYQSATKKHPCAFIPAAIASSIFKSCDIEKFPLFETETLFCGYGGRCTGD